MEGMSLETTEHRRQNYGCRRTFNHQATPRGETSIMSMQGTNYASVLSQPASRANEHRPNPERPRLPDPDLQTPTPRAVVEGLDRG